MSLLTVEGIYRNGKLELVEEPVGVDEARVVVVFLPGSSVGQSPGARDEEEQDSRRQAAFADMARGIDLGGPPYPRREEIYDRFAD